MDIGTTTYTCRIFMKLQKEKKTPTKGPQIESKPCKGNPYHNFFDHIFFPQG